MKVTLHRVVMPHVDILLDVQLKPENARSFFHEVAGNLLQKGYVSVACRFANGRVFWRFKFNDKNYILSLH